MKKKEAKEEINAPMSKRSTEENGMNLTRLKQEEKEQDCGMNHINARCRPTH